MVETPLLAKNTHNKLLIVEPDASAQVAFFNFFKSISDYTVNYYSLGTHALSHLQATDVDVIVSAYDLQDVSAEELISEIRKSTQAAIVLLASRLASQKKVELLSVGVDVVLDEPIDLPYLKAVIERLQTRKRQLVVLEQFIDRAASDWYLSLENWLLISPQGTEVELSATEFKILSTLVENSNQLVSREELAKRLGRDRCQNYAGYINTTICRLRKKVYDQLDCEICIRAYRSKGYLLTTPVKVQ